MSADRAERIVRVRENQVEEFIRAYEAAGAAATNNDDDDDDNDGDDDDDDDDDDDNDNDDATDDDDDDATADDDVCDNADTIAVARATTTFSYAVIVVGFCIFSCYFDALMF